MSVSALAQPDAIVLISLHRALCNQYMALTSRGVTITFASGDGGVASTPGTFFPGCDS